MATDATVIGPTIRMQSRGGLYGVQGVQCRFSANGVNVCIATLAVGKRENSNANVALTFERGDEAKILVSNNRTFSTGSQTPGQTVAFTKTEFTLFDGIIDDFGIGNLAQGIFSVQVRIFGRLAYLAAGALGTSNIVPSSHLDTAVYFAWGSGTDDNPAQISLAAAKVDFWDALQYTLQNIAIRQDPGPPNSVVKTIQSLFGSQINAKAYTILEDIDGKLDWNLRAEPFAPGITTNINTLMMSEWQFASFFQRICELGEMLRFKLIENGSGIRIVPYTPFFTRQDALVITPRTYDQFRWDAASEYRNYSGCVLVEGAHHDILSADQAEIVGVFELANNTQIGQVHVGTVPAWLAEMDDNMFTGGGESARTFTGVKETGVGDTLAKYMTWELNYKNRRFTVSCPFFRTDIGPLEAVRVDFPSIPEIQGGTADLAVFGSVETVDITIDAAAQQAKTTYTVSYARSYRQQERQIDADLVAFEHPFFTTNYVGGRLDTHQIRSASAG